MTIITGRGRLYRTGYPDGVHGHLLRGLKFFFADTVFVHQFVQLAAADAGITCRIINLAPVTGQDIFQIVSFNFFNTLLPDSANLSCLPVGINTEVASVSNSSFGKLSGVNKEEASRI